MVVPLSRIAFSTQGRQRAAARKTIYQKYIRDYLRCGATVDDNIGKLLQALDDMGIADNTIVVYVSDQGYFWESMDFSINVCFMRKQPACRL